MFVSRREATDGRAEGDKQAAILRAEGDAKALLVRAESEAAAIAKIKDSLGGSEESAASYIVAMRYLESLESMTEGESAKTVFLPYEATGVLGALGGIRELVTAKTGA